MSESISNVAKHVGHIFASRIKSKRCVSPNEHVSTLSFMNTFHSFGSALLVLLVGVCFWAGGEVYYIALRNPEPSVLA